MYLKDINSEARCCEGVKLHKKSGWNQVFSCPKGRGLVNHSLPDGSWYCVTLLVAAKQHVRVLIDIHPEILLPVLWSHALFFGRGDAV